MIRRPTLVSCASLLAVSTVCVGCFRARVFTSDPLTRTGDRIVASAEASVIQVSDAQGLPIAGARVLIGARENVPFPGNLLTTDADGRITPPATWTDQQPVTIEAPGFIRATFFGRENRPSAFVLHRIPLAKKPELKGENTGFGPLPKDGFLDIGLVFPAVSRGEAATMQLSNLVSPESDKMNVFGQSFDVPSNMSFPTQKETYVIPLTFSKPVYRFGFAETRQWKVVSAHARFPVKAVADKMQANKSFYEMVNDFDFREASVRDIVIAGPLAMDLPVNEVSLKPLFNVQAPKFDTKYSMISVALAATGDLFFVTDVKKLGPKEKMVLSAPKTSTDGLVVSLLKEIKDEDIGPDSEVMSAIVASANQGQPLEFLPMSKSPSVRSGTLVLDPPRATANLTASITYAVLSKVEVFETGGQKLEKKAPQWELYAEEWAPSLTLPEMPGRVIGEFADPMTPVSSSLRWTVLFGGQPAGTPREPAGPGALEKVSHVTRSAVDL